MVDFTNFIQDVSDYVNTHREEFYAWCDENGIRKESQDDYFSLIQHRTAHSSRAHADLRFFQ